MPFVFSAFEYPLHTMTCYELDGAERAQAKPGFESIIFELYL